MPRTRLYRIDHSSDDQALAHRRYVILPVGPVASSIFNSSLFRYRLEVGQAFVELAADHPVHAEKDAHHLGDVGISPGHGPGHIGLPACGCSANTMVLWPSIGLIMSSRMVTCDGGAESVISSRPLPACPSLSQSFAAPLPLAGPL